MIGIKPLWRGEIPLARAYWLYGVGALCALNLALGSVLAHAAQRPLTAFSAMSLLALALLAMTYCILVSVAIWRSAGRYDGPAIWPALARGAVAAGFACAIIAGAREFGLLL